MPEPPLSSEGFVPLTKRTVEGHHDYVAGPELLPAPASLSQVLDEGIELLRDNLLILTLTSGVLTWLGSFGTRMAYFAGPTQDEEFPQLIWMSLVSLILIALFGSLLVGVSAVMAVRGYQSGSARRTGLEALRGAHWVSAVFTSLLVGMIVAAFCITIFPLGFYFAFRLMYATTAACYEGRLPGPAIARSWRLTRKSDRFGEWLGLLACLFLLGSIPLGLGGALSDASFADALGKLIGMNLSSMTFILEPLSAYMMGIGTALGAAVFGRFQLDLLARRDGLDLRRRLAVCFPRELAR